MSPEALRRLHHEQGSSDEDLREAFGTGWLAQHVTKQALALAPRAAEILDIPTNVLRNKLKVRLANTTSIDCVAHRHSTVTGKRIVTVHAGYLLFLNKLCLAYASEILRTQGEPEVAFAVADAARLLTAFVGRPQDRRDGWAIRPGTTTSPRQQVLQAVVLGWLQEATLAHELGHVIHDLARRHCIEARQIAQELPDILDRAERRELLAGWTPEWTDELVADVIAAELLRAPAAPEEFAPQNALVALIMIVELIETGQETHLRRTHPPAGVRRAALVADFPYIEASRSLAEFETVCRTIATAAGRPPPPGRAGFGAEPTSSTMLTSRPPTACRFDFIRAAVKCGYPADQADRQWRKITDLGVDLTRLKPADLHRYWKAVAQLDIRR